MQGSVLLTVQVISHTVRVCILTESLAKLLLNQHDYPFSSLVLRMGYLCSESQTSLVFKSLAAKIITKNDLRGAETLFMLTGCLG